jgi:hypothetical protein
MNDPRDLAMYAADLVTGSRQVDYDHPFDNFSRAAKIWGAILGIEVSAEQVALCMVGMKISREVANQKLDTAIKEKNQAVKDKQKSTQIRIQQQSQRIDAECKLDREAIEILNDSARDIATAKAKK